ncbi:MAG: hypothetical protein H6734_13270 [Alphaproteobacteria bacterium]|nr:hypothetical protein [Alphaproteobacteria bacterium]
MSDDYLFDGGGTPDPEVARLESLLAPYAHRPRRGRTTWVALAAVVLLGVGAMLALQMRSEGAWSASTASCSGCTWEAGAWLDTSAEARARLADRGEVVATPGTRVRRETADGARLTLEVGRLDVRLDAPARWLLVQVPGVEVVDLGCAYALEVAPDGTAVLEVRSGAVALEGRGPRSFVPAGAVAASWPDGRTGMPVAVGADASLVAAVDGYDRGELGPDGVVAAARSPADALTLWHLVQRVAPAERERVAMRVGELVAPAEVDREGLARLDPTVLDATLGLVLGRGF